MDFFRVKHEEIPNEIYYETPDGNRLKIYKRTIEKIQQFLGRIPVVLEKNEEVGTAVAGPNVNGPSTRSILFLRYVKCHWFVLPSISSSGHYVSSIKGRS